ncbi:MAG: rhomboid family intramembrane serine protease [Verrucomicrobiota bacterium]
MITTIIIATAIAIHLVQILSVYVFKTDYIAMLLAFQLESFKSGMWWQILTYGWIHSVEMPIHILFNLLTVHYIGRELEWQLGRNRYLLLYVAGLLGAVGFWYVTESSSTRAIETLAGASGAVFALFGALAAIDPKRYVKVLVMFVIPLRGEIRWFFWGSLAVEVICWKFGWLPFIAHTAHMGGGFIGWGLARFWRPKWVEV